MIKDDVYKKTDEELVNLVLENNEYFFYLMKRYEKKLFLYIKKISNLSNEEIEDCLQDIFLKVYLNLNKFKFNGIDLKFSSWIYRISHNETINIFRKKKLRKSAFLIENNDNILKNIKDEFEIKDKIDLDIFKKKIELIFSKIDYKYKEILILRFLEEKDYKEISDILEKPMGTIAVLINRAKKKFKKIAEEEKIKF